MRREGFLGTWHLALGTWHSSTAAADVWGVEQFFDVSRPILHSLTPSWIPRHGYNENWGWQRLYEQLLPAGTVQVAATLAEWPALSQFYLAGGTALALHLGHRQSRDLDFFTQDPQETLSPLGEIEALLARFHQVEWELNTPQQLQLRLDDVSVTFMAYPFPHSFGYHPWQRLAVADARDVAVQKAYTVGRRAQARDYLDLHAVLTRGILPLDDLMRLAHDTYGDAFSARLFLQQLIYTEDLPDRDTALTLLVKPQSFDVISEDLSRQVQTWMAQRFQAPGPSPRGSGL